MHLAGSSASGNSARNADTSGDHKSAPNAAPLAAPPSGSDTESGSVVSAQRMGMDRDQPLPPPRDLGATNPDINSSRQSFRMAMGNMCECLTRLNWQLLNRKHSNSKPTAQAMDKKCSNISPEDPPFWAYFSKYLAGADSNVKSRVTQMDYQYYMESSNPSRKLTICQIHVKCRKNIIMRCFIYFTYITVNIGSPLMASINWIGKLQELWIECLQYYVILPSDIYIYRYMAGTNTTVCMTIDRRTLTSLICQNIRQLCLVFLCSVCEVITLELTFTQYPAIHTNYIISHCTTLQYNHNIWHGT